MGTELSNRLEAVVNMTEAAECIADIGCDHGFVSIALMERALAKSVIACDVKSGPLAAAKEHVRNAGLEDMIDLRLADGLSGLRENEADGVIIAGMGGPLGLKILYEGKEKLKNVKQVVLQIQSKIATVRYVLKEWGFQTVSEEMVFEDGKYYVLMNLAVPEDFASFVVEDGSKQEQAEAQSKERSAAEIFEAYLKCKEEELLKKSVQERADYTYGEFLIKKKNPLLLDFLEKEEERLLSVAETLCENIYGDESTADESNAASGENAPGRKSLEALGRVNEEIDILMNAKWRICGIS